MNVKLGLCLMGSLLMPSLAQACDVMAPKSAFFAASDTNQNGVLDRTEWQSASIPANEPYRVDFNMGSMAVFKHFDLDRNGVLTEEELPYNAIFYITDPCEGWLKAINQTEEDIKP